MLKIEDIKGFTMAVVSEVAAGIESYNATEPTMRAGYPPCIEIQTAVYDEEGDYHQFWMKIPVWNSDTEF